MILVIDANLLGKDRPLEGNLMRRVLDEAGRGRITLVLPEVVVSEVVNLWSETVADWERKRQEALRALTGRGVPLDDAAIQALNIDALRDTEETRVRASLSDAGVRIADYPAVSHRAVTERALARRQPFDAKGHDGYRDVLLWETVLELAQDDDIVLATRDGSAFYAGRKPGNGLAPALEHDLKDLGLDKGRVRVIDDLQEAFDLITSEAGDDLKDERSRDELVLGRAREWLADGSNVGRIDDVIADALMFASLGNDLRPYGLDADVYDSAIDMITNIQDVAITEAHVLSNGQAVGLLDAMVQADVEIDLHPSDATLLDSDGRASVRDFGYGTHNANASASLRLHVSFEVTLNPESGRIESLSLRRLAPVD